jgi:hypothetical protein
METDDLHELVKTDPEAAWPQVVELLRIGEDPARAQDLLEDFVYEHDDRFIDRIADAAASEPVIRSVVQEAYVGGVATRGAEASHELQQRLSADAVQLDRMPEEGALAEGETLPVVPRLLAHIETIEAAIGAELTGIDAGAEIASLIRNVKRRHMPQGGRISGVWRYAVHGFGCLFTSADGLEIDVDITPAGRVIVDRWRVRAFAAVAGMRVSPEQADEWLEASMLSGHLEELPDGWYSPAPPPSGS